MSLFEEIRNERIKKLNILKEQGIEAFPVKTDKNISIAEALKNFSKLSRTKKSYVLAGRVMAMRGHGALIFCDINDGETKMQVLVKKDDIEDKVFDLFSQTVDVGDFIEVKGNFFLTKRKEKSLSAKGWKMLTKSLRPLPDKWHGLQDTEERFRRRYLDILMSPEVRERFEVRSKMISEIRNFLSKEGYLEVETPILQSLAGGATAEPFTTHHNALDMDLFLRIAPEIYLKKLLIGGFSKVFEIGRNFRNEGIDVTHNPEFTMLEFYEAYSDAEKQRNMVEKMMKALVKNIFKKKEIEYNGEKIDFSKKFTVVSYYDLLRRYALLNNPESASKNDLEVKAKQLGIDGEKLTSKEKIMDAIFKKMVRPKLIQPTFVIDYPVNYLPLAKRKADDSSLVDAFQFYAGSLELVKAFSELNDPIDQMERFVGQEKEREAGDKEAQKMDAEFVEAMEYGMPPAGGVGIGLDRLTMFLTNTQNIREVIIFPTLRPKTNE